MKRISAFILFAIVFLTGAVSFAEEMALFPEENLSNLSLIAVDPETNSFIIMNKAEEVVNGTIGDSIGTEGYIAVVVDQGYVLLERMKIVEEYGEEIERPTRIRLPLAYGVVSNGTGKGIQ